MKKLLQFLMTMYLSVAMVGCYSTEEPVGPDVPVVGALKLSQEEMTIGAEGGEFSVDIFTEYSYETSTNVDWITISGGSCGTEYCTLYFTVAKNDTTSEREGVITVFCDNYSLSATLTVTQEAGENTGNTIPNNEIWYTSSDDAIITPYATDVFGANIVSNTYENGQGVIKFDGDVTQIGERAFYAFSSTDAGRRLASIIIPDSVTSIGNYAFDYCKSLTSVTIPDSVTSIGRSAFGGCRSLTSITIPDGVTLIGEATFCICTSLTSVTIGNSVTSIGGYAFSECTSLTNITIPNSVTSIGNRAFNYCTSLTSVTIGNSVTSIGEWAFSYCTSLKSVTIPDSVTSIGDGAFYVCDSLTSIIIPDSVTEIGVGAFHSCRSLTSITIPDSVTTIGRNAFSDCTSLTEVYCKPATPPTGDLLMFHSNASERKIYVPRNSVEAYKAAQYWSDYASDIVGYDF